MLRCLACDVTHDRVYLTCSKNTSIILLFRPISLTSTLCKILERLVTTRLTYHVEKNNLLSNVQPGFRQGRCTVDQIMRLQDAINKHNQTKGFTVGVFIDFQSAFDMVWQKGQFCRKFSIWKDPTGARRCGAVGHAITR